MLPNLVLRHSLTTKSFWRHIYIHMHTYITYIHYMTLHDITWHYMTLHDMTLHDMTWHDITLHDITWHYMTLHYIHRHTQTYIALHCIASHHITSHHITSHHITSHTSHHITSHHITLHTQTYTDIRLLLRLGIVTSSTCPVCMANGTLYSTFLYFSCWFDGSFRTATATVPSPFSAWWSL